MPRRPARFVLLLLGLVASIPAGAADKGLYVSLKLGTTDVDASYGSAFRQVIDGNDESVTFEAGFRYSSHWAIQAAYHDFGSAPGVGAPCGDEAAACPAIIVPVASDATAYSLAIVPQLPLGRRLSLFGKIGLVAWDSQVRQTGGVANVIGNFSEEDLLWGVGARVAIFGPLEVFYEYEGIGDTFETQAFGATLQF